MRSSDDHVHPASYVLSEEGRVALVLAHGSHHRWQSAAPLPTDRLR